MKYFDINYFTEIVRHSLSTFQLNLISYDNYKVVYETDVHFLPRYMDLIYGGFPVRVEIKFNPNFDFVEELDGV